MRLAAVANIGRVFAHPLFNYVYFIPPTPSRNNIEKEKPLWYYAVDQIHIYQTRA